MPRNLITNSQRKALRVWYNSQPEKPKLNVAQEWWASKFGSRVSNGTCSRILSARYDALDRDGSLQLQSKRQRPGKWVMLEDLICDWIMDIEANGGHVNDTQIIAEAGTKWPTIKEYADQAAPKFSGGWLRRLKIQLELRKHRNKEVPDPLPDTQCRDVSDIRQISLEYKPQDIYSMSETILHWKSSPWDYIQSKSVPGKKPNMVRISIALCVNSDGLDKFPPFYIGKGRQLPKALAGWSLENNGYMWFQNQNGWMDGECMLQWLNKYCSHVGTERKVLLLLNYRFGRLLAASKFVLPHNVRVEFLRTQSEGPLNCGIIRKVKALYRKTFLEYSIEYLERNVKPRKNMINLALVWFTYAWLVMVSPHYVNECFIESKLVRARIWTSKIISEKEIENSLEADILPSTNHITVPEVAGFREAFDTILRLTGNEDCGITLDEYTEPAEEREFTETLEQAACFHSTTGNADSVPTREDESEQEDFDTSLGLHYAQEQLQSLTEYMMEHKKCDQGTIGSLQHLKHVLDQWAVTPEASPEVADPNNK